MCMYEQIKRECLLFREAVEKNKDCIGIEWFKDFPRGCCQDVSLILALYLHKKGFGIAEVVSGWRGNKSHAWLELDDMIIDITADQFDDVNERVLVTTNSKFHEEFKEDKTRALYNQMLTGANFFDVELFNAYDIILKEISEK